MNQKIISRKSKEIDDNYEKMIRVEKKLLAKFASGELTENDIKVALIKIGSAKYRIGYNDGEKKVYDIYPNDYIAEVGGKQIFE